MRLQVDRTVQRNLNRFRTMMQRILHKGRRAKRHHPETRDHLDLSILVHKESGQIQFPELSAELAINHTSWQPLVLRICFVKKGEATVEALSHKVEEPFCCTDFSNQAYLRLKETVEGLTHACQRLKGAQDLHKLIAALSEMGVDPLALLPEGEMILEAWQPVDRVEAEKLLRKRPVGSFLLRKDRYAEWLESSLQSAYEEPIKCFTLTYLAHDEMVREKAILHFHKGWIIYDDDTELRETTYPSLRELFRPLF